MAADGLTKALQGQAFGKFVELLRMMSPDMSERDSQPNMASLRTGMCSHPAVGACLVAGVALMEQAQVVASLVIMAALILGTVEGKVKTRPAIRPQLQQDPQKVDEGDTPYGFSRSSTPPHKTLAGGGILPLGQGVGELEGVGKPGIRAFRANRVSKAMVVAMREEMWQTMDDEPWNCGQEEGVQKPRLEKPNSQEEIMNEFQSSLQSAEGPQSTRETETQGDSEDVRPAVEVQFCRHKSLTRDLVRAQGAPWTWRFRNVRVKAFSDRHKIVGIGHSGM